METWQGTEALILSGGPGDQIAYIADFLQTHPAVRIVCADSGIRHLQHLHCQPDLIVGDFDSSPLPDIDCELIRLIPEKDDTDTMHALQTILDRGCTSIWIACATGGRLDHLLSNLSLCEYAWEQGGTCHILDAQNEVSFLPAGSTVTLQNDHAFRYFSLIPLDRSLHHLSITGAKYPLQDASVTRSSMYTISNEFQADTVEISLGEGHALLIRSRDQSL